MPPIPRGYPFQLADDELQEAIVSQLETVQNWPNDILPELRLALIAQGLQEQARRETGNLRRLTQRATKTAAFIALAALAVGVLSLIVSLVK